MSKGIRVIAGMFVSNLIGMTLIWFSKFLMEQVNDIMKSDYSGVFIFSDFIIIPIVMGIICAFFWSNLNLLRWQHFLFRWVLKIHF